MKEVRKNLFNYTQHCNYKIEKRVVYRLEALACLKKKVLQRSFDEKSRRCQLYLIIQQQIVHFV